MPEFNDRREDRTRDWRIGAVKSMMEAAAQRQVEQEPFVDNYPGKFIPTPKQVAKADKAKTKRVTRARRRSGL